MRASVLPIGLAVECATAADWPNQLDRTGYESGAGCEIRSGAYTIGLISWAAIEGSTVSSLICDRWLTRKLATFMGSTDSLECYTADMTFGCGCGAGPIANLRGGGWGLALALLGWTCSEPLRRKLRRPGACHAAQYICTP